MSDYKINILGLECIDNYISIKQEDKLLELIDGQPWNMSLKRRTQHYGYKYDYTRGTLDQSYYLGRIPLWIDELCHRLYSEFIFKKKPDQVIINEYMPGQGIAPHVDSEHCFSDTICSLSMGSGCIMDLINCSTKIPIFLKPRSLLVLKKDARYKWKHGIAARKRDNNEARSRRVSLTFRKVI